MVIGPFITTLKSNYEQSKQFGIWMEGHHATFTGNENLGENSFTVTAHVNGEDAVTNPSEKIVIIMKKLYSQSFLKK